MGSKSGFSPIPHPDALTPSTVNRSTFSSPSVEQPPQEVVPGKKKNWRGDEEAQNLTDAEAAQQTNDNRARQEGWQTRKDK
jgi:hypothetical protein